MKRIWWLSAIFLLGLLNIVFLAIGNKDSPKPPPAESSLTRIEEQTDHVDGAGNNQKTEEAGQVRIQEADPPPESNVSQVQIDIMRKKEEARRYRDEMLKVRAETIRTARQQEQNGK